MTAIAGKNILEMVGYTTGLGTNGWRDDMEANLRAIDALVQAVVISASVAAQPETPSDGDCYIVPPGATGAAWGSNATKFARYNAEASAWDFYAPKIGWSVYNQANGSRYVWDGTTWQSTRLDITGSRGGNAALASLLSALDASGIITDSTTA